MISKVLIPNRGEIALRIIKACKALGIRTVAAVSEADKESLPAKFADEVVCIGPSHPSESYLKIETIITAALGTGANAIHPGYGFLAEQWELAEACETHGLIFIGPPGEIIKKMGNKLQARQIAEESKIPVLPGSQRIQNVEDAIFWAKEIGYPVILKAAAGGGGRGMRIITTPAELKANFEAAAAEALAAFGDGSLYLERYIPNARHIEVQILGDKFGNVIHLGERDCTLQRRYQKIIEEAPASFLPLKVREDICTAAVKLAKSIGYENAGTIEFIFDQDEAKFYFLEVNTRIQVEHPVTEMVTGIDIVQEQIRIAAGEHIRLSQAEIKIMGHAIECRVTAESPEEGFRPSPGRITRWIPPKGPGIRVDTHCYTGYFVPPYYDSLLAKVITVGINRREAIKRMEYALQNFVIEGVETTLPFLKFLITQPEYIEGKVNTKWVEMVSKKRYNKK